MKRINDMKAGDSIATDRILLSNYGKTVQTNAWGVKQYVISDPLNIQTILAAQVDKFGSAPMNRKMCAPFLGDGVMTTDGHMWKKSRQMINPVFARAQVSELSSFEAHLARLIARIPTDGSTIDMQPLCKMLFLDSSTEFIFGKSANSLSPETNSPIARSLPGLFDEALTGMFTRYMLGKFKFFAGSEKKYLEKCAEVHKIIDGFIDEEIELQSSSKKTPETQSTAPYSYVLLKELVKTTDDKRVIRNELMNVFFPARDTAAIHASNVLFMVARHPAVWHKMRAEVLSIGSQNLTFEILKSLKYMQAVMNESKPPIPPRFLYSNTYSGSSSFAFPSRWKLENMSRPKYPPSRWRAIWQRTNFTPAWRPSSHVLCASPHGYRDLGRRCTGVSTGTLGESQTELELHPLHGRSSNLSGSAERTD